MSLVEFHKPEPPELIKVELEIRATENKLMDLFAQRALLEIKLLGRREHTLRKRMRDVN